MDAANKVAKILAWELMSVTLEKQGKHREAAALNCHILLALIEIGFEPAIVLGEQIMDQATTGRGILQ